MVSGDLIVEDEARGAGLDVVAVEGSKLVRELRRSMILSAPGVSSGSKYGEDNCRRGLKSGGGTKSSALCSPATAGPDAVVTFTLGSDTAAAAADSCAAGCVGSTAGALGFFYFMQRRRKSKRKSEC